MEKPISDHVVLINEQNDNIIGENKPPSPIRTRVQTLRGLSFSKPKARSVEFNLNPVYHRSLSQLSGTENEPLNKPSGQNPSPIDDWDSDEESSEDE